MLQLDTPLSAGDLSLPSAGPWPRRGQAQVTSAVSYQQLRALYGQAPGCRQGTDKAPRRRSLDLPSPKAWELARSDATAPRSTFPDAAAAMVGAPTDGGSTDGSLVWPPVPKPKSRLRVSPSDLSQGNLQAPTTPAAIPIPAPAPATEEASTDEKTTDLVAPAGRPEFDSLGEEEPSGKGPSSSTRSECAVEIFFINDGTDKSGSNKSGDKKGGSPGAPAPPSPIALPLGHLSLRRLTEKPQSSPGTSPAGSPINASSPVCGSPKQAWSPTAVLNVHFSYSKRLGAPLSQASPLSPCGQHTGNGPKGAAEVVSGSASSPASSATHRHRALNTQLSSAGSTVSTQPTNAAYTLSTRHVTGASCSPTESRLSAHRGQGPSSSPPFSSRRDMATGTSPLQNSTVPSAPSPWASGAPGSSRSGRRTSMDLGPLQNSTVSASSPWASGAVGSSKSGRRASMDLGLGGDLLKGSSPRGVIAHAGLVWGAGWQGVPLSGTSSVARARGTPESESETEAEAKGGLKEGVVYKQARRSSLDLGAASQGAFKAVGNSQKDCQVATSWKPGGKSGPAAGRRMSLDFVPSKGGPTVGQACGLNSSRPVFADFGANGNGSGNGGTTTRLAPQGQGAMGPRGKSKLYQQGTEMAQGPRGGPKQAGVRDPFQDASQKQASGALAGTPKGRRRRMSLDLCPGDVMEELSAASLVSHCGLPFLAQPGSAHLAGNPSAVAGSRAWVGSPIGCSSGLEVAHGVQDSLRGSKSSSQLVPKPILVLKKDGLQRARSLGRRVRFNKQVEVVVFS